MKVPMNDPTLTLQLTQRGEDLSTESSVQFRFFCDGCGDAFTTGRFPKSLSSAELLEDLHIDAQRGLRQCLRCHHWVCRDLCWNPIQCLCENCSATPIPQSMDLKRPAKRAKGTKAAVYSSILGNVCPRCEADIPDQETVCPECGQQT